MASLAATLPFPLGGNRQTILTRTTTQQPASASTDYGTDIAALVDLPDPEVLISGPLVVAYAVGRRWLTQSGALADIGDQTPYASFDVRDYLGARVQPGVEATIQRLATAAAIDDERVTSATVACTFAGSRVYLSATITLADGPFQFVLSTDGVTASLLQGT